MAITRSSRRSENTAQLGISTQDMKKVSQAQAANHHDSKALTATAYCLIAATDTKHSQGTRTRALSRVLALTTPRIVLRRAARFRGQSTDQIRGFTQELQGAMQTALWDGAAINSKVITETELLQRELDRTLSSFGLHVAPYAFTEVDKQNAINMALGSATRAVRDSKGELSSKQFVRKVRRHLKQGTIPKSISTALQFDRGRVDLLGNLNPIAKVLKETKMVLALSACQYLDLAVRNILAGKILQEVRTRRFRYGTKRMAEHLGIPEYNYLCYEQGFIPKGDYEKLFRLLHLVNIKVDPIDRANQIMNGKRAFI